MISSICIVITKAPGEEDSALGIRTSYSTHMSGIETKTLCTGDGIYNLIKTSEYNTTMLNELIKEDGEIYCIRESLEEKGLTGDVLLEKLRIMSAEAVWEIIESSESVVVF